MRQTEPTVITQGEALEWEKSFCDFPSDEYTLQYRFRGPGTGFNEDATAQDDGSFLATVTAANTLAMSTGRYQWQAWLTEIADSTNSQMIAEGVVDVRRGFADDQLGTIDLRTPAKIALESIDAAMAAFATSDVQEYEISTPAGTRRVKRSARADLLSLRKHYAMIVARETAAERGRNTGKYGRQIVINVREQ
jgi:hypothetical protein